MIQVVFLALAAMGYTALAQNPCGDSEWRYSPHSGMCYKLIHEKIGWTNGEFKCWYQQSHQVSIHSEEDNRFVAELAGQAGTVWVGAAQFGNNPDYVNADHTPFDYENWVYGSRPEFKRGKKCIKMDGSGRWTQSCCKVSASLICKKKADFVPAAAGPVDSETFSSDPNNNIRRKFMKRV